VIFISNCWTIKYILAKAENKGKDSELEIETHLKIKQQDRIITHHPWTNLENHKGL
jgi:hypothetical protein